MIFENPAVKVLHTGHVAVLICGKAQDLASVFVRDGGDKTIEIIVDRAGMAPAVPNGHEFPLIVENTGAPAAPFNFIPRSRGPGDIAKIVSRKKIPVRAALVLHIKIQDLILSLCLAAKTGAVPLLPCTAPAPKIVL